MTAKEQLRERIDEMTEDEASELLDFLALQDDPDELSEADIAAVKRGLDEIARGDFVTQAEFEAKYGL
jgi:predicted transcriptional regulator